MTSPDNEDTTPAPSTDLEVVNQRVAWLRAELEKVQETAQRAVATRPVGPLDEWVNVLKDYAQLGQELARTDFVPKDFRGKPEQVTAAMMYGREIGLPPLTTLQNTHVIHGRVGMYAEQLRAMILAAGHEYEIEESTSDRCVIAGRRKGSDRWISHTYTMDQAKLAGLYAQNEQYRKRPTEMLLARASGIMAHAQFPDVIRGMGALEEMEVGEATEAPPVAEVKPSTSTVQRKASRSTKAAAAIEGTKTEPREFVVPDQPGLPPLPGEETAPESVTDEPARRTETEIVSGAASGPTASKSSPGEGEAAPEQGSAEETTPAEPAQEESGPVADKPRPIGPVHTRLLQARFRALGYTDEPDDRETRLKVASVLAGRDVETFRSGMPGSLTHDQAQAILAGLAECRDRDDVLELMVKLAQDAAAEDGGS
jgi:hypothetical protein